VSDRRGTLVADGALVAVVLVRAALRQFVAAFEFGREDGKAAATSIGSEIPLDSISRSLRGVLQIQPLVISPRCSSVRDEVVK
jgi:hypothetical protein